MGLKFSLFNKGLKEEQPAQGISVEKIFDDAIIYNVTCDCGVPEHSVKMWIEAKADSEIENISVSFYVDTYSPYFNSLWDRIKYTFKLLIFGQFKVEHCFLLNKQSALNFSSAIHNQIQKFTR